MADHTYNQNYKIGRSMTETDISQHAYVWSVSAGFSRGYLAHMLIILALSKKQAMKHGVKKMRNYTQIV